MAYCGNTIGGQNLNSPVQRAEALELGKRGEELAVQYLIEQGYAILERNYRKGKLEIDIIALDGEEIVVVEVKTRSYDTILQPEEAVNHRKQLNLLRLANQYIISHRRTENVRMDIIAIVTNSRGTKINHIKDAFEAPCL